MDRKYLFFLIPVVLIILVVFCNLTGAAMGGQAGTVALGYAVAEQAQANQEMAHAVRTQANANVWVVGLVVGGMLGALALGLAVGRRSTPALPPSDLLTAPIQHMLPPGVPSVPPEQVLNHLFPGVPHEARRKGL